MWEIKPSSRSRVSGCAGDRQQHAILSKPAQRRSGPHAHPWDDRIRQELLVQLPTAKCTEVRTTTVPFGVRDVIAVFLVGGLGCQRECGEAAVVVGANFCVAAEEADEGCVFYPAE